MGGAIRCETSGLPEVFRSCTGFAEVCYGQRDHRCVALDTRWYLCHSCAAQATTTISATEPRWSGFSSPLVQPLANPEHDIAVEVAMHAIARLLRLLHDDAWRAEAWATSRASRTASTPATSPGPSWSMGIRNGYGHL